MRFCQIAISLAVVVCFEALAFGDEPLQIAVGKGAARPQQPQIAIGEDGVIHVAFGASGRALYVPISPGNSSQTEAKTLPECGVMSLGMRRGPRIAVTKTGVCITLIAGDQGKGKDGDILSLHTSDSGATWSKPAPVNDQSGSAREGLHAMASGPDRKLACTWLDLRNDKSEVMLALSTDGGSTWPSNQLVYKSPDGGVCPCCHPSIAFGKDGAIHVMWRNALGGARDMFVATSTDSGKSFSKAKKLGAGTWTLDKCPMDGGMICADAQGALTSIWRREKELFLCQSGKNEISLEIGEQPWIAATSKGPVAAWISRRGGALYLLKPGETKPMKLDTTAADPVVASSSDGNTYAIAWERREGDKTTLLLQRFGVN